MEDQKANSFESKKKLKGKKNDFDSNSHNMKFDSPRNEKPTPS